MSTEDGAAGHSERESSFAPIGVGRASSAITERIRSAIVSGELEEGARLPPERELAEQLGVSRVTVRDALRALEAMGLVEIKIGARGGAFVTVPTGAVVAQTMSDMMMMSAVSPEDIVEARLLVELGIVTLACVRANDDDLHLLRENVARGQVALAGGLYTREISWEFHALVARAAHNGAVNGMSQSFSSTLSLHPVRMREGAASHELTVEEHGRIVDALERRDAGGTRREMAGHLLRNSGIETRSRPLLDGWGLQPSTTV